MSFLRGRGGFASGSAIVQGITPYVARQITIPGQLEPRDWPPFVDHERLSAYEDCEALVEARPWDAFDRLQLRTDQSERVVLAMALPELLCNVWADALYGENAPEVDFAADTTRETWDRIWSDNGGADVLGWEETFSTAMRGTGVVHVYRDDDEQVQLEPISPALYFPRLKPGSARIVEGVRLAWEEDRADPDAAQADTWHVKKTYELVGGQLEVATMERRANAQTAFREIERVTMEGVDFVPFVETHAKRWTGRYWGVSELTRSMSLFAEVDARLSQISEILDYHGDPMLQVPASVLMGGELAKGNQRVIGLRDDKQTYMARYITFDGMISQQLAEVDSIISKILLVNEVEEAYFGQIEGGSPSGTALRLRLQNYVKKAGRWQRKDGARLEQLADFALRLEDPGLDEEARRAVITFGSPLPADEEQEARIEAGLVSAGLSTRKTAITRLRRVEDVDAELAAIDADQAAPGSDQGLPLPAAPGLAEAGLGVGTIIGTGGALPPGEG
jgi:hypothetical protein